MMGLSTSGSISFGCAFVAGRNRVPKPAAGKTALRTIVFTSLLCRTCVGLGGLGLGRLGLGRLGFARLGLGGFRLARFGARRRSAVLGRFLRARRARLPFLPVLPVIGEVEPRALEL